jgi:TPR repeat protein
MYKKAASKNDDKAFYNLALCYEYGEGLTRSTRWAEHYYLKVAKFGNQKSKEKLKDFD